MRVVASKISSSSYMVIELTYKDNKIRTDLITKKVLGDMVY